MCSYALLGIQPWFESLYLWSTWSCLSYSVLMASHSDANLFCLCVLWKSVMLLITETGQHNPNIDYLTRTPPPHCKPTNRGKVYWIIYHWACLIPYNYIPYSGCLLGSFGSVLLWYWGLPVCIITFHWCLVRVVNSILLAWAYHMHHINFLYGYY